MRKILDTTLSYEPVTQFQSALSALDIESICVGSLQAKDRVEKANETLQDRLIKEMLLLGINYYEQANLYTTEFVREYNHRFAVIPGSNVDFHCPLDFEIEGGLCPLNCYRPSKSTMLARYTIS